MRTRPATTRKLKWFGVKTLFRTAAEGRPEATDSAYDRGMTMVEERVVLYRTSTAEHAIRAAEADARSYARDTHLNPYGQPCRHSVSWCVRRLRVVRPTW